MTRVAIECQCLDCPYKGQRTRDLKPWDDPKSFYYNKLICDHCTAGLKKWRATREAAKKPKGGK